MSKAQVGLKKFPNGRDFTKEHREKIVAANKGKKRPNMTGTNHPRWKGGVKRAVNGYTATYTEQHPSGQLYVLDHRLVMERMIGRPLLDSENVHHKNGIRDDNRPENLELWTTPQPSGIRAEDALAWAHEIIKRYNSIYLT